MWTEHMFTSVPSPNPIKVTEMGFKKDKNSHGQRKLKRKQEQYNFERRKHITK